MKRQGQAEMRGAKPRIAHIVSELRPGGVEVRTLELLQTIHATGENHVVITLTGSKGSLAPRYEALGIRVLPLRMKSLSFPIRFIKTLKCEKITVLQCNIDATNGYLVALGWLGRIRKRICHYRSDGPVPRGLIQLAKRTVLRCSVFLFATDILGVAPSAIANQYCQAWRKDPRCQVVPNGVTLAGCRTVDASVQQQLLEGTRPSRVVAHVGRGVAIKNREMAIRVIAAARRSGQDWGLLFVGRDGNSELEGRIERNRLISLAQELGVESSIHFAGERGDVPAILGFVDVLLVTSREEGLPGVILEATAAGLPVVSSALPGAAYIAATVPSVEVVALDAALSTWVAALSHATSEPTSDASRESVRTAIRGTEFDLDVSSRSLPIIWGLNRP